MNPIINNAIKEWGLQDLPEAEQLDMVERLGRLIYQAVLVRSLDILSDAEQTEFDLLLDEDDTTMEDVVRFLERKIPTFNFLLKEEIQKLKDDVLVKA